jgi:hypothetical protein
MEIARHWRLKAQRYGLAGDVCPEGHKNFPPDDVCKQCDPDKAIKEAIASNTIKMAGELRFAIAKMKKAQEMQTDESLFLLPWKLPSLPDD